MTQNHSNPPLDRLDNASPSLDRLLDAARRDADEVNRAGAEFPSTLIDLDDSRLSSLPADSFAGYQIVREIHRGGQGVVYQAVHAATHRKVAIKVLREGPFVGAGDRARFEREARILAQLDHSNIVAVHDSGVTTDSGAGRYHYFIMDYISGQPLDTHMAGGRHSVAETLKLFVTICDAVNAAHLRGIIHRDLKPSNIRVDQAGEPHILDFGLAKVTGDDCGAGVSGAGVSPVDMVTLTGQFVGSLPWASPEQAEGVPSKIDVRTDVYSLGVILYQMLTSKFPYEVIGPMRDVLDRIMHAAPVQPRTLRREINDDVETIVLKCLNKDRERRYQSAGELARDIRHYLAGEPIEAKRDSFGYVLRKALLRHRVPVAIAAAFLMLILCGTVVSTVFWQRAERESAAARDEAEKAEQISDFLQKMLASLNPERVESRDVSLLLEALDEAGQRLEIEMPNRPQVRATLHTTIGKAYRNLGHFERAEKNFRAALAIRRALFSKDHTDVADSLRNLGLLLQSRDPAHFDETGALLDECLAMRRRLLGDDHPAVAESLIAWADHHDRELGWDEVKRALQQALAIQLKWLGEDHSDTAYTVFFLGQLLAKRERYGAAEPYFRQTLEYRLRKFGENSGPTASVLRLLAELLLDKGEMDEASAYAERALDISQRVLPRDHLGMSYPLSTIGRLRMIQCDPVAAEWYLREAVRIRTLHLPAGHWRIAKAQTLLGECLVTLNRFEEAEPLLLDSYSVIRDNDGDQDRVTRDALERIIALYESWGKTSLATEWHARRPPRSETSEPVPSMGNASKGEAP